MRTSGGRTCKHGGPKQGGHRIHAVQRDINVREFHLLKTFHFYAFDKQSTLAREKIRKLRFLFYLSRVYVHLTLRV